MVKVEAMGQRDIMNASRSTLLDIIDQGKGMVIIIRGDGLKSLDNRFREWLKKRLEAKKINKYSSINDLMFNEYEKNNYFIKIEIMDDAVSYTVFWNLDESSSTDLNFLMKTHAHDTESLRDLSTIIYMEKSKKNKD